MAALPYHPLLAATPPLQMMWPCQGVEIGNWAGRSTPPSLVTQLAQHSPERLAAAVAEAQARAQLQAAVDAQARAQVQMQVAQLKQCLESIRQEQEPSGPADDDSGNPILPPGMMLKLAAAGYSRPAPAGATSATPAPAGHTNFAPSGGDPSGDPTPSKPAAAQPHAKGRKAQEGWKQQQPGQQKKCRETLRTYLQELRDRDPRCVFIARRINKLGFQSKKQLDQHYSQFGEVVQVLVAHSKVKPFPNSGALPRTRPGNFGLVVMKSHDAVGRVLAQGVEQNIGGVDILVHRFEQLQMEEALEKEEAEERQEKQQQQQQHAPQQQPQKQQQQPLNRVAETPAPARAWAPSPLPSRLSDSEAESWQRDFLESSEDFVRGMSDDTLASTAWVRGMFDETQASTACPSEAFKPKGSFSRQASFSRGDTPTQTPAPATMLAGLPSTMPLHMNSQLATVLSELSRIARDRDGGANFSREESIQAAAMANWAQQSLKALEKECQQTMASLVPPSWPLHMPAPGLALPSESEAAGARAMLAAAGQLAGSGVPAVLFSQSSAAAAQQVSSLLPSAAQLAPLASGGPSALQRMDPFLAAALQQQLVRDPSTLNAFAVAAAEAVRAAAAAAEAAATVAAVAAERQPAKSPAAVICEKAQQQFNRPPVPQSGNLAVPAEKTQVRPNRRTPTSSQTSDGDSAPSAAQQRDTLRSHLLNLSAEDPQCIFITRQINKLGFRSREILQQHYSHYGTVRQVLVAHSKVRLFRDSAGKLKTRPGGLGFIVMDRPTSVATIQSLGEEQIVAGHQIRVQSFEKPKVVDKASYHGSETSTASTTNGTTTTGSEHNTGGKSDSANESSEKSDFECFSGGSGSERVGLTPIA